MKALLFFSGLFTLVAQTALVREVLAAGGTNELILGILLGAWLAWVGGGALLAGLFPVEERERAAAQARRAALFFLPGALLQVGGALFLREITGTAPGDYFSLWTLTPALLLLGAPVSLVTGFLFSRASAALAGPGKGKAATTAYGLEALGSLAGGGLITLWLGLGGGTLPGLLLAGSLLYGGIAAAGLRKREPKNERRKSLLPALAALAALLAAAWPGDPAGWAAGRLRFELLHPGARLLDRKETPYGLTEIARLGDQVLVFRDGSLFSASPDKEQAAIQSGILASQPLHRKRLLFLGIPPPSLLADLLAFPWKKIVAVDPDRAARELLAKRLPPKERKALLSPRIQWIDDDPRPFLARGGDGTGPFDLAAVFCSDLGRAAAGRDITREALLDIRKVLARGGVFALGAPLVERAFDEAKLDFGLTLLATVENVFPRTALVPGVYAWFLASRLDGDPTGDGKEMEKRLLSANILPPFLPRGALASACDPLRGRSILDLLHREEARRRKAPLHTDARPSLFFAGLAVETRYRDPRLARVLTALGRAGGEGPAWVMGTLFLLVLLRLLSSPAREKRFSETISTLSTAVAGGAGISLFLALLLTYQCKAGLLYEKVGLASGLFLAGMALAAFLGGLWRKPGLLLGGSAMGYFLLAFLDPPRLSQGFLLALFPAGGLAAGLVFPAGAALLGRIGAAEGNLAARLEGADHGGAALGGTAAGVLLVPVLGLQGTILFCALLTGGIFLFLLLGPGRPGSLLTRASARFFPFARGGDLPGNAGFPWPRAGFFMLWTGASLLGLVPIVRARLERRAAPYPAGACRLLGGDRLVLKKKPFPHARIVKKDRKEPLGDLFATSAVVRDVYGYAGPIDLLVVFDRKGVIRHVQVLSWEETPAYVEGAGRWLRKAFVGRKLGEVFVLRRDLKGKTGKVIPVEGMAGATITSRALVELMTRAGKKASALLAGKKLLSTESRPGPPLDPPFWYLVFAFPLGILVYLAGGKWTRRIFLLSSFLLGGLWSALQLAPATLVSAWLHGFSPSPTLLLLSAGGLAAAVLAGPAYCSVLCPLGALQEAFSWFKINARPPKKTDRLLRSTKYFLLFGIILFIAARGDPRILSFDPLAAAFGPGRTSWTGALLLLILGASLFFYRFWCRYLCPLGAFFLLFTRTAPLLRFSHSPLPEKCDTGILHPGEGDCLHCRRCVNGETAPPGRTYKSPLLPAFTLALSLLLCAGALRQTFSPGPEASGPALPRSASTLRKVDERRIRRLIQSGDLNLHPARYAGSKK